MGIVKEYKIGNTTIKIADDAVRNTPEEINAILTRIVKIAWPVIAALKEKGKDV